jgi:hypothetical protein
LIFFQEPQQKRDANSRGIEMEQVRCWAELHINISHSFSLTFLIRSQDFEGELEDVDKESINEEDDEDDEVSSMFQNASLNVLFFFCSSLSFDYHAKFCHRLRKISTAGWESAMMTMKKRRNVMLTGLESRQRCTIFSFFIYASG